MTAINLNQIFLSESQALSCFEEDGKKINREPIGLITPYTAVGVDANKDHIWDFSQIGHDTILLSLFAYSSTAINNNDSFLITIKEATNNAIVWQVKNVLGNAFYYLFLLVVVSKRHLAVIRSSVNLVNVTVFGKTAYLDSVVSPSRVE